MMNSVAQLGNPQFSDPNELVSHQGFHGQEGSATVETLETWNPNLA